MKELPVLKKLKKWFEENAPVAICFSGGIDSGLLVFAAREASVPFIVCYGESPAEGEEAKSRVHSFVKWAGASLCCFKTDELKNENYLNNPPDRCYYCKVELFSKATSLAKARGISTIIDGTNVSDLSDHRPGMKAAEEFGIRSPYVELNISKPEIKDTVKRLGLPLPPRPTTCIATRFPFGVRIQPELFEIIRNIEKQVLNLGFSDVRARVSDGGFRIEVPKEEVPRLMTLKHLIIYPIGYKITIDPEGYRPAGQSVLK